MEKVSRRGCFKLQSGEITTQISSFSYHPSNVQMKKFWNASANTETRKCWLDAESYHWDHHSELGRVPLQWWLKLVSSLLSVLSVTWARYLSSVTSSPLPRSTSIIPLWVPEKHCIYISWSFSSKGSRSLTFPDELGGTRTGLVH